ncbi:MAG: molybdopterin-guanine dinucleotide biosynthesis protein B [Magnetococcales bacterium]|nr:molybdopterin-guanine dinucleotide biosynthesis protein B [Magnetococcales bacterium]NGZ26609.1 molybdopterin-guanine dinucleotide biosynthesis protein B [Magnetococcales bacterium]
MSPTPPVFAFAAASGTGKTTLMTSVIEILSQQGLRVAALKHGHHPGEPDIPGKDSYRFRQAGAATVLFACPQRWFMIQELSHLTEPSLEEHLTRLAPNHDLILVEGFHGGGLPKILIHRQQVSPPLADELTRLAPVIAIASDVEALPTELPVLPLNDPLQIARFILSRLTPLPALASHCE